MLARFIRRMLGIENQEDIIRQQVEQEVRNRMSRDLGYELHEENQKSPIRSLINKIKGKGIITKSSATLISPTPYHTSASLNCTPTLNFNVHKADGGLIIECRHRDTRTDDWVSNLYLCKEDEDLGEKLNGIITVELLKI